MEERDPPRCNALALILTQHGPWLLFSPWHGILDEHSDLFWRVFVRVILQCWYRYWSPTQWNKDFLFITLCFQCFEDINSTVLLWIAVLCTVLSSMLPEYEVKVNYFEKTYMFFWFFVILLIFTWYIPFSDSLAIKSQCELWTVKIVPVNPNFYPEIYLLYLLKKLR